MLVLSRKIGESILISDNIKINIINISGDKVTIAIDAPKEIKIMREELLETIEANQDSNVKFDQSDFHHIAELLRNKKTL